MIGDRRAAQGALVSSFATGCVMPVFTLRFPGLGAALLATLGVLTVNVGAAAARAESAGAGLWDISRADANRGCRLTLRNEETAPGRHVLAAPAGCRKALPILGQATAWASVEGGALRLLARDGGPLLEFAPKERGRLEAIGPEGETYRLTTQGGAATRWPSEGRTQTAQAGTPAAPALAAAPVGAAPPRGAIAGRYAVLREEGRDTGCMVTMEDRGGRGPKGSSRAFLAPACRDQGLVIFNPVGWTLAGGKLTLYADKGHSLIFLPGADGKSWSKDPASGGKPVSLRRL